MEDIAIEHRRLAIRIELQYQCSAKVGDAGTVTPARGSIWRRRIKPQG